MTKREIAFVLSLIATIASPTFLWFFLLWELWVRLWRRLYIWHIAGLIVLIILIMTTGLFFMGISKTKRGRIIGGTIILGNYSEDVLK